MIPTGLLYLRRACAVAFLSAIVAGAAAAPAARCPGSRALVEGADRQDLEAACGGAADAVTFLSTHGLDVTGPVTIRLVARLPEPASGSSYGCYLRADKLVYMLGYAKSRKDSGRYGPALDRALYRSLVAHEVAHLIAAANFTTARPSTVAQEYIAYVTMFATMEPATRERLMARLPGTGFDSERQINLTYLGFDPNRFGAQSYRHFLHQENGAAFLNRILTGLALAEDDPP